MIVRQTMVCDECGEVFYGAPEKAVVTNCGECRNGRDDAEILKAAFTEIAALIKGRIGLSPGNELCLISEQVVKKTGIPKDEVVRRLNVLSGFDPDWRYFVYVEAKKS